MEHLTFMKEIQLSKKKDGKNYGKYVALVDDTDFEELNKYNWTCIGDEKRLYAYTTLKINHKIKRVAMHRFIMRVSNPCNYIDHIDHNGLNNQRINLRKCNNSQNQMNKRPRGTSKYLGVYWHTLKKKYLCKKNNIKKTYISFAWLAHISINGKTHHLGRFDSEIEAAKTYDEAAKRFHKDFANLNFK